MHQNCRFPYLYFRFACRSNIISELFPLRYPINCDTLYLGGILTSIWIWSGQVSASIISTPLYSHSFLRMLPISARICPYIASLRYFGAMLCDIYSSSVYGQDYLFPLSFVFQTWIFLLCYFSCGRQTCFDCSMGGLSFPSHRLSLFYSTGIARGCLFSTKQKPPPNGGGFFM